MSRYLVAASTALSLAVVEVAPVKAADFASFLFSFGSDFDSGGGYLFFKHL